MEVALYHPQFGYYRIPRDPFGKDGDFYTAEQLQPVFGRLIRKEIDSLFAQMPGISRTVVELGAGREEMRGALEGITYLPIESADGAMPAEFSGIVFANEFFDALPVDVVVRRGDRVLLRRVDYQDGRFAFIDAETASDGTAGLIDVLEDNQVIEVSTAAMEWMDRIAAALVRGFVLLIDYGYTRRELVRFPEGTLMSYRHHRTSEDVLSDPGTRDITAHVCFSALEGRAVSAGLRVVRFESLAQTLLRAGEPDQFASAIAGSSDAERQRHQLQLKTLLFGMGETFRVLLLEKRGLE